MASRRHRVVVIGAGFGGLAVAKSLADSPVDVLVIDRNNFHTFQPLLYQVASAGLSADDIAYPVRGILRRQRNATFRMGTVTGADLDADTLTLEDGSVVGYDSLVVAAGAVTNSYGVSGVDEYALGMKSVDEAEAIRSHLLARFERAAINPDELDDGIMNVVVCGGGPTGVELSGGISELYRHVLDRDAPDVGLRRARIVLVEAADRLLTPFRPESSARALDTLNRHGVEVRLGVGVERVTADGVDLSDGTSIDADTVVWAAGVRADPLGEALGLPLTARGRIAVEADLSIGGHANVYAIGDIAGDLPQVAQPAIQGGRHVARQIAHRLRGEPTTTYEYRDKGSMATIGRNEAVTELPNGRRFTGFIGWVAWLGLHLIELVGMRNRLRVLVNWGWNYVTYDRGARLLAAKDSSGSGVRKRPPSPLESP